MGKQCGEGGATCLVGRWGSGFRPSFCCDDDDDDDDDHDFGIGQELTRLFQELQHPSGCNFQSSAEDGNGDTTLLPLSGANLHVFVTFRRMNNLLHLFYCRDSKRRNKKNSVNVKQAPAVMPSFLFDESSQGPFKYYVK